LRGEPAVRPKKERRAPKPGQVCTTISAKTVEEMAEKAATAFDLGTDIVEFRIDLADETLSRITEGLGSFARRAIFTVRRKEEGGGFKGSEIERLGLISDLSELRPLYLDIELSTATERPDWYGSLPSTSRRIVSWHDFTGTPSLSVLRKARASAGAMGEVAKIVTMAKKRADNLRVLKLYEEDPEDLIAFCMGAAGSASRLASLQLGSPVTYASLPTEPVAPGQLSVTTIVGLLGGWRKAR
jgi:3-dehydroquinate dehydratase-1